MTERRKQCKIFYEVLAIMVFMAVLMTGIMINNLKIRSLQTQVDELKAAQESMPTMESLVQYSSAMIELEEPQPEAEPEPVKYYTDDDAIMLAKLMYAECRGVPSKAEKAAVVWTALNRIDDPEFPDTIAEILTQQNQFAYRSSSPVWDDLLELSYDVLERWNAERNGSEDVGRVLPVDYEYFYGDGVHNHFYKFNSDGYRVEWDFQWGSPYGD